MSKKVENCLIYRKISFCKMISISINKNQFADCDTIQHYEWLETNGLGGYSSSTVLGMNTRKYHGIFVPALQPPVGRTVLVNKLDETISVDGNDFELGTNQYPGSVSPKGYLFLQHFERAVFPEWTYKLPNGIELKKTLVNIHGENTVVIHYEVIKAKKEFELKLRPYSSFRDCHSERTSKDGFDTQNVEFHKDILSFEPVEGLPKVYIKAEGANFKADGIWFENMEYLRELDRGHAFREHVYSHGELSVKLQEEDEFYVVISTKSVDKVKPVTLFDKEYERRIDLFDALEVNDSVSQTLTLAADQFIVNRGAKLKTVIAGYPWFSDWGRDTMISLPGLCLSTGRYEDAKKILLAFAEVIDKGMIPNRFPELGEEPEYNTVDATLWYFVALFKYITETDDKSIISTKLWSKLKSIIDFHEKGTRYGIKEQADGLLFAGEDGVQLTWMDAKINDWVVTPRIGKPVEINALWYNALKVMELYAPEKDKAKYEAKASFTLDSFRTKFWSKSDGYLFDVITDEANDNALRPNQLFALSLPFPLFESGSKEAKSILKATENHLLTPYGLRSLSDTDVQYKPIYTGDQLSRDGAYHQGTVWSWLIGAYMDAKLRNDPKNGEKAVQKLLDKSFKHLHEAGLGTVSEIFDGQEPYYPQGCIAQAWGVAEWLRLYIKVNK
ncbi:MAG: hypothetical protein RLZZ175_665 [Bacteroidota bacterium]|jgi:predicted glycogen debranching enzyme